MTTIFSKFLSVLSLCLAFAMLAGCSSSGGPDPVAAAPVATTPPPPVASNAPPTIKGVPPQMVKVGVSYTFTPTAEDPDSDPLTFSISNQPNWTAFDSSTGQLSGVANAGSEGTYNDVVITVSDGAMSAALPAFSITVEPVTAINMPPEISGAPPASVIAGDSYAFTPTASDPDGDPLTFSVINKPAWARFDAGTGRLAGTPQAGDEGQQSNIAITVSDEQTTASLPAFSISVQAAPRVNAPPEISGTPPTSVIAGEAYAFSPIASDPDGDPLTFSVINKPSWAGFDAGTGRLAGTPQAGDQGQQTNIAITVSDGQTTASLPAFSISVEAAPLVNAPPQISGTPPTSVTVGDSYAFTPTASDADGDLLAFSVTNKPDWASFNSSTGTLSGSPSSIDVGTYDRIRISVSDGQVSTPLPQYTIDVSDIALGSVTLSWTPPTRNNDGSVLTDLAGYKIYYGVSEGTYPNNVSIDNPGIATFVVEGLIPNTYYFVATSINSSGAESDYSNEVIKTAN